MPRRPGKPSKPAPPPPTFQDAVPNPFRAGKKHQPRDHLQAPPQVDNTAVEAEALAHWRRVAAQAMLDVEERARKRAPGEPPEEMPAAKAQRLRALAVELATRKMEGLALYEPLPVQAKFHQSAVRVRILRGSNRSGKT